MYHFNSLVAWAMDNLKAIVHDREAYEKAVNLK